MSEQQHVPTLSTGANLRPIPDPTELTSKAVEEGVRKLRELIETRLAGMDRALDLTHKSFDRIPVLIRDEVSALKELHAEKFHSIATQFVERDTRTEQTSRDSKVAVDAALQAAKEAVGEQNKSNSLAIAKSETSTTKQLDQIQMSIAALSKSVDDKLSDVKERMSAIDGRVNVSAGAIATRSAATKDITGYVFGAVGMAVGIVGAVIAIVRTMH